MGGGKPNSEGFTLFLPSKKGSCFWGCSCASIRLGIEGFEFRRWHKKNNFFTHKKIFFLRRKKIFFLRKKEYLLAQEEYLLLVQEEGPSQPLRLFFQPPGRQHFFQ